MGSVAPESIIHESVKPLSETFNPREDDDSPKSAREHPLDEDFSNDLSRFLSFSISSH